MENDLLKIFFARKKFRAEAVNALCIRIKCGVAKSSDLQNIIMVFKASCIKSYVNRAMIER